MIPKRRAGLRWLLGLAPGASGMVLILVASACTATNPVIFSHDDWGENCTENSAPAIANLELNSRDSTEIDGLEDVGWFLALHFDWQDPTPPDNPDPQNLVGGMISIQILDKSFNSLWIDSDILKNGCANGPSSLCAALGYGAGLIGCSGATAADCTTGQVTIVMPGDPPLQEYENVFYEIRIRDACGASSAERNNYRAGAYELGSGQVSIPNDTEDEEATGGDDGS